MLEFYHCTSDIFLDSIKKNGLGKINPNFDLKLLDLLTYVFKIGQEKLADNNIFNNLVFSTQLMINQEIKKVDKEKYGIDILNFKHDGVFVTLGDRAAITHSHYNKYGSEILSTVMKIITILKINSIEFSIPKSIDMLNVLELLDINPKPILIKIKHLDYDYLFNKRDVPMGIMMYNIENKLKYTSEKVIFSFKQTSVFKYVKEINLQDCEIYYLEYDGHPTDEDFEYFLSIIR